MKRTALVTAFLLGLSSVALAAPTAPGRGAWKPAPTVIDHRGPWKPTPPAIDHRALQRPIVQPVRWTPLSSASKLGMSRFATSKAQINVRSKAAYSTVKLEAKAGSTFVDKVVITFGNGRSQTVELDRTLSARSPLVIDLNGDKRFITKIVVYGKGGLRSSFSVLAT